MSSGSRKFENRINAAMKIQAVHRGRQGRKKVVKRKQNQNEFNNLYHQRLWGTKYHPAGTSPRTRGNEQTWHMKKSVSSNGYELKIMKQRGYRCGILNRMYYDNRYDNRTQRPRPANNVMINTFKKVQREGVPLILDDDTYRGSWAYHIKNPIYQALHGKMPYYYTIFEKAKKEGEIGKNSNIQVGEYIYGNNPIIIPKMVDVPGVTKNTLELNIPTLQNAVKTLHIY